MSPEAVPTFNAELEFFSSEMLSKVKVLEFVIFILYFDEKSID